MRLRNVWCLLFSFALSAVASFAQQAGRLPLNNYGKLPLVFEANHGQADPQVRFLFRGSRYTAFLTSGSMVLSLRPANVTPIQPTGDVDAPSIHTNISTQAQNTTLQFK